MNSLARARRARWVSPAVHKPSAGRSAGLSESARATAPVSSWTQIADAERQHKLPLHGAQNLFPVAGNHKQFIAVGEVAQRIAGLSRPRIVAAQRTQTAANFLQAKAIARQIFDDFQTDQIVKRIESWCRGRPRAAPKAGEIPVHPNIESGAGSRRRSGLQSCYHPVSMPRPRLRNEAQNENIDVFLKVEAGPRLSRNRRESYWLRILEKPPLDRFRCKGAQVFQPATANATKNVRAPFLHCIRNSAKAGLGRESPPYSRHNLTLFEYLFGGVQRRQTERKKERSI